MSKTSLTKKRVKKAMFLRSSLRRSYPRLRVKTLRGLTQSTLRLLKLYSNFHAAKSTWLSRLDLTICGVSRWAIVTSFQDWVSSTRCLRKMAQYQMTIWTLSWQWLKTWPSRKAIRAWCMICRSRYSWLRKNFKFLIWTRPTSQGSETRSGRPMRWTS